MDEPIEVTTPVVEQAWAGLRTIAIAGGAFAAGRGWIEQDALLLLSTAGAVTWGIVASQLKTWERSRKLVTMAKALPDDIARVK